MRGPLPSSQAAPFHSAEPPMQPTPPPQVPGAMDSAEHPGRNASARERACVTALTSAPPPRSARAIGRRLGARDRGPALRRKGRGEASGLAER